LNLSLKGGVIKPSALASYGCVGLRAEKVKPDGL